MSWLTASLLVVLLWGIVGLLQKVGANHSTADSLLIWTTAGYAVLLPLLAPQSNLLTLTGHTIAIGLIAGFTNALGAWCLYAAMEKGAIASVAVPLTALNPLLTVVLAQVFLHERLTPAQMAGITLALAAGVLLSYERNP